MFLLDEPLAALDRKLREDTRFELVDLQDRLGLTFVIVTHDQEEAMTVADRIGVMNAGKLVQVGPPAEVYEQPASRWVADFIGDVNLIEGRVVSSGAGPRRDRGRGRRTHAGRRMRGPAATGATVWVALRPEKLQIATQRPPASDENSFAGRVEDIGYLGDVSLYKVKLDNGLIDEGDDGEPHAADRPPDRLGRPGLAQLCARGRRGA